MVTCSFGISKAATLWVILRRCVKVGITMAGKASPLSFGQMGSYRNNGGQEGSLEADGSDGGQISVESDQRGPNVPVSMDSSFGLYRFMNPLSSLNWGGACSHIAHTIGPRRGHQSEKTDLHPRRISYLRLDRARSDGTIRVRFPLALPIS